MPSPEENTYHVTMGIVALSQGGIVIQEIGKVDKTASLGKGVRLYLPMPLYAKGNAPQLKQMPLQQNSWVNSGSGRSPRLWYRAVS